MAAESVASAAAAVVDHNDEDCNLLEWRKEMNEKTNEKIVSALKDPNVTNIEIKAIVGRVEDLYLEETYGFWNVLYDLNGEGFPLLKKLHIHNNTNIKHIIYSTGRKRVPRSFPNLETMILDNLNNLKKICYGPLNYFSFQNLKVIKVKSCGRLEYLFFLSRIEILYGLVEIEVSECRLMKHIVLLGGVRSIDEIRNISLRSLTLQHLPAITGFCSKGNVGSLDISTLFPNAKAALPGLKHLKLISISTIKRLVLWTPTSDGVVPLQNLETMEIAGCKDLNYLFFVEALGINDVVLLPELRQLCLRNLASFTSIIAGLNNHWGILFKFKMLTHLRVCGCNQLKYLLPLHVLEDLQLLKIIDISDCKKLEQVFVEEQNTQTTNSSNVMDVVLPLLQSLKLSNLPELASICSGGDEVISGSLTQMTIENCPKFIFTFAYMEEQEPSKKKSEEIIVINPSKVENLSLRWVDHLKNMCEYPLVSVVHLTCLQLWDCNKLEYMFSLTMAQELYSLQELKIIWCERMEQIVRRETEETASANTVEFPQLKTLILEQLPNFTGSSSQEGASVKWLALNTVKVAKCSKIQKSMLGKVDRPLLKNVTVANCPPWESKDHDSNISYLFDLTDELSKLENLRIEHSKQLKKYMAMELHESYFRKLKTAEALECDNELNKFLSILLHRSNKLERLTVERCQLLEQVFDLTEFVADEEQRNLKFPNLKAMQLLCLPKLKCIWNMDPRGILELGKLVKLEIIECGLLNSLLSAPLVEELVLLEQLKIESCKTIELVVEDDDTEMQERSFRNLKDLHLASLPKLIKFTSGLCNFRFPNLLSLRIGNCPTLETLPWTVSPKADNSLNKHSALVLFDDTKEHLNIASKLESLELADLPYMQLWKQEPQIPVFQKLTSLKIIGCESIEKLFSIPVAEHLSSLKLLTLYECVNMVQVLQGGRGTGKQQVLVFKKLETLVLKHLPRLTSFSEEDVDFDEFPELNMVRVEHVPNMYTFVKRFLKTRKLKQVHVTYITKCWLGDLNKTITYLHQNHDKLKDEVWECDQSSRHHKDTAQSSSQVSSRFKEAAEAKLHGGMQIMESRRRQRTDQN